MVHTPHTIEPKETKRRLVPKRSDSVPKRKVEKAVTKALVITISVTIEESFAIFAYTKVLNH